MIIDQQASAHGGQDLKLAGWDPETLAINQ